MMPQLFVKDAKRAQLHEERSALAPESVRATRLDRAVYKLVYVEDGRWRFPLSVFSRWGRVISCPGWFTSYSKQLLIEESKKGFLLQTAVMFFFFWFCNIEHAS